jgi:hypothetical protein
MKPADRWIWIAAGVALAGLVAIALAERFWIGGRTVYFDDCRKRVALQDRLRSAAVPFELVERGGISIGRIDEKELAARLGLPSLLDVPPDKAAICK